MKQTISAIGLSLLLALGLVTPAFADVRSELEARRTEVEAKIKVNQERLKTARESVKTLGKDVKKAKVDFRFDLAKHRGEIAGRIFDANIERLEKLITRIENHRIAYVGAGASTTEAAGFISLARANIADAKLHMNILRTLDVGTTSLSTTTAKVNWENMKSEAKTIRELLVKAKQNLQKAVNSLAKMQKLYKLKENDVATGTATSTN